MTEGPMKTARSASIQNVLGSQTRLHGPTQQKRVEIAPTTATRRQPVKAPAGPTETDKFIGKATRVFATVGFGLGVMAVASGNVLMAYGLAACVVATFLLVGYAGARWAARKAGLMD